MSMSHWSIKHVITGVVMLTCLIAMVLTIAGIAFFDNIDYRKQMEHDLLTQAKIIGSNSSAALAFNDVNAATEILSALSAKRRVVTAELYTKDHIVLASYTRDPGFVHDTSFKSVNLGTRFDGNYLRVGQDINLNGERLGVISIQSDMSDWYARTRRFVECAILILVVAGVIALFLALRLQRLISDPILSLAATMHEVSRDKDYTVCAKGSRTDEIGDLIEGFNTMLFEIQQRDVALLGANTDLELRIDERTKRLQEEIAERKSADDALRRAHGQLEERVRERTADLATTNQALQAEVAERRSVEAALRVSEDKFRSIVETTEEFIWEVDAELKMTYCNPAVEAILGYSPAEIAGTNCRTIMHSGDADHLDAVFARCINEKHGCAGVVSRWKHKDGGFRFLERNAVVVLNESGDVCGFRGADRDVTARKQAEHEMMQAMAAADAANHAKSLFLANMSHELRTPLNAIIGFSEILVDQTFGPLNEKQTRYSNNILNGGRHLLQLINDVLDLSKVEAGKLQLEPEMFAPAQALLDVRNIVKELASKKNIELTANVDPNLPEIEADQSKFKQILYNLLSNAIKFTPDGGEIMVKIGRHKPDSIEPDVEGIGWIEVSVTDSGIGIAEEDLQRIFEEFEQVDSSYGRQQQGTGLGLTLTRRLIELHGGTIQAYSAGNEGQGSTFKFFIPISQETIANRNDSDGLMQLPELMLEPMGILNWETRPTVLVVEDDETSAELLTHYLSEGGYHVEVVTNGEHATETARRIKPCAIVLDVLLPIKDGWQVMAELNSLPETQAIPVIVVSIAKERQLAFELGAVECLVKPVDKDQLVAAINRYHVTGTGYNLELLAAGQT